MENAAGERYMVVVLDNEILNLVVNSVLYVRACVRERENVC